MFHVCSLKRLTHVKSNKMASLEKGSEKNGNSPDMKTDTSSNTSVSINNGSQNPGTTTNQQPQSQNLAREKSPQGRYVKVENQLI